MESRSVETALNRVQLQIRDFEHRYERKHQSVALLAVSKRKPASAILSALANGQREFGENYVDEGVDKIRHIGNTAITWHYIGAIQSRKCRLIAEHFQWVHSIDRVQIASKLNHYRSEHQDPLHCCIQVKLDEEPGKAGVSIDELGPLMKHCQSLPNLRLRGLMAIPAPVQGLTLQRQSFSRLASVFETLKSDYPLIDTLSMGMTADMEAAIAEGSTMVRVGTAIFGPRDT